MGVTACTVVYSVHKKQMACPESMVDVVSKQLINHSHVLTSCIPSWPDQRFMIFYPMSRQNTREITSLMSSFQIGVISTSIALGPHISLLQRETTDYPVTAMKENSLPAHSGKRSVLYSSSHFPGQFTCLLLHSTPIYLKVTEDGEGS